MKYLQQFGIILAVSFVGRIAELCDSVIDSCKYIRACTDVCMPVYEMDRNWKM